MKQSVRLTLASTVSCTWAGNVLVSVRGRSYLLYVVVDVGTDRRNTLNCGVASGKQIILLIAYT